MQLNYTFVQDDVYHDVALNRIFFKFSAKF